MPKHIDFAFILVFLYTFNKVKSKNGRKEMASP